MTRERRIDRETKTEERERERVREEGYRLLAEEIQLAFAEDERAIRFVNREREWETLVAGSAFGRSLAEFLQINEENKRETRDV